MCAIYANAACEPNAVGTRVQLCTWKIHSQYHLRHNCIINKYF